MKKEELPNTIPVFPLSNFIIFPKTSVPLNIFEPRYIEMINDSMKANKLIGMIQPKSINDEKSSIPSLHKIGCLGKITSFKETEDGRYLIVLNGISRFKTVKEIENGKLYREFNVNFDEYQKYHLLVLDIGTDQNEHNPKVLGKKFLFEQEHGIPTIVVFSFATKVKTPKHSHSHKNLG